jgi:hypothetical protein
MKQTISNACGTVALLHSVLNNLESIQLKEGALKVRKGYFWRILQHFSFENRIDGFFSCDTKE